MGWKVAPFPEPPVFFRAMLPAFVFQLLQDPSDTNLVPKSAHAEMLVDGVHQYVRYGDPPADVERTRTLGTVLCRLADPFEDRSGPRIFARAKGLFGLAELDKFLAWPPWGGRLVECHGLRPKLLTVALQAGKIDWTVTVHGPDASVPSRIFEIFSLVRRRRENVLPGKVSVSPAVARSKVIDPPTEEILDFGHGSSAPVRFQ